MNEGPLYLVFALAMFVYWACNYQRETSPIKRWGTALAFSLVYALIAVAKWKHPISQLDWLLAAAALTFFIGAAVRYYRTRKA